MTLIVTLYFDNILTLIVERNDFSAVQKKSAAHSNATQLLL